MMLLLVVVGEDCASLSVMREGSPPPAWIMQPPPDWQMTAERDYFTLRERLIIMQKQL